MKANTIRNATFMTAFLAAIFSAAILVFAQAAKTFGDEEISLRREDPLKTTLAPKVEYAGKEPGENRKLARSFFGAPPMIPHSVRDTELNLETNDCLECHGDPDEDTPGLPPSHKIKAKIKVWKRSQAKQGMVTTVTGFTKVEVVNGSRYDCMLCHAPQAANIPELVGNGFEGPMPKHPRKDVLDQLNSAGKF
ncbi:MAG: nitrate reductase cytochrome c-type subunit [bacterium]